MTQALKRAGPIAKMATADVDAMVQIKVWLRGISPMVWRRLLMPSTCSLRAVHGIVQVATGWEGIHLYQFCLRAQRLGSWELSASSPDVTLAALQLRRGTRFTYEYDLNIPWRHELRVEDHLTAEPGRAYPRCTGGSGACPPEDCGGPEDHMAGLDEAVSLSALEDLDTVVEVLHAVVLERRPEALDDEARWRLEAPSRAAEHASERRDSRSRAGRSTPACVAASTSSSCTSSADGTGDAHALGCYSTDSRR